MRSPNLSKTVVLRALVALSVAPLLGAQAGQRIPIAPEAPVDSAGTSIPEVAPIAGQLPEVPFVDPSLYWADWSGDGLVDAWVVQPDGSGLLLRNTGDGRFVDRTVEGGLKGVTGAHLASWEDVDGDGKLDLFLASWTSPCSLFLQVGDGHFVDVTSASGIDSTVRAAQARWFDFDEDGTADLHMVTEQGDVVYRGLGRAEFEMVDLGLIPRKDLGGGSVVLGLNGSINGGAGSVGPNSSTGVSAPGGAVNPLVVCASFVMDQATGICIEASSTPTMGKLYPISNDWYINPGSGFVGIGTTNTPSPLTVSGQVRADRFRSEVATGTAPMIVQSTTRVDNLNADFLDGHSSANFRLMSEDILSGEIADDAIGDQHVAAAAAIAGTKINPAFGDQTVTGSGGAHFIMPPNSGAAGVRGEIFTLSTNGYLGVQGSNDFGGAPSADWLGQEIGVVGISRGSSVNDNYGVVGHSNNVGVRGEHSTSPSLNYGELGRDGIGVFGKGVDAAARFEGKVEIEHSSLAMNVIGGTSAGPAVSITNPAGGSVLSLRSSPPGSTSASTALSVIAENQGIAAYLRSTNQTTAHPTLRIESSSNQNNHDSAFFRRYGTGSGSGLFVEVRGGSTGTSDGIRVDVEGTGEGVTIASTNGTALVAERSSNGGNIITAANGTDLEFRVASIGDVFADGAFLGGGADYAEWLERADPLEAMQKGDVVGVRAGKISLGLQGADTILVLSTNPCLVGNHPEAELDKREGHEIVAFLGQVPVRVLGPVQAGDLLVPSGKDDGTAIAIAPMNLNEFQIGMVIGRAWESSEQVGVHSVLTAIGLDRGHVAGIAIRAMRIELNNVQASMQAFEERLRAVEQRR